MRLLAAIAATLLLTACGSDEKSSAGDPAPESTTPESTPTVDAFAEACDAIVTPAPAKVPGRGWKDVLAEADYFTDSEDADVRALARDTVDAVRPVVNAFRDGASATDWDNIIDRFQDRWTDVNNQCR